MKNTGTVLLLLIAVVSLSFTGEVKQHSLHPYKGMDDSLLFRKTTRASVISQFGEEYTLQHVYGKESETSADSSLSRIIQRYPKLGISFVYMIFDTTVVHGITVNRLFPAVTDKGIVAGRSTMNEVELLYGISDWKFTDTSMFREYGGIAFAVPFNGKFPVSDATLKAGEKKIISQIDIYYSAGDINR